MTLPKLPNGPTILLYAAGGALVVAVGYVALRRAQGDTRPFTEIIAGTVAKAAVQAVEGVAVGTVKGIGSAVGIPDTSADLCAKAKAAGNVWDASKYCSAGDFLTWSANRVTGRDTLDPNAQRPTLRQGSQGEDVKVLQRRLGIPADGVYGSQTVAAVKAFQSSVGLIADGVCGPHTWAALESGKAVVNQNGILISGSDRDLIR